MGPSSFFSELNKQNLLSNYYKDNPVESQIDNKLKESFDIFNDKKGTQIKDNDIINQTKQNSFGNDSNSFGIDLSSMTSKNKLSNIPLDNFNQTSNNSKSTSGSFLNGILGEKAEGEGAASSIASEAINVGKGILDTESTQSKTTGEGISRGISNTMNAAKLGMTIGGPIGAGIGAVGGAVYSAIDFFDDQADMRDERIEELQTELESKRTKREEEFLMEKGKKQINKLKRLKESQLNYVSSSNY